MLTQRGQLEINSATWTELTPDFDITGWGVYSPSGSIIVQEYLTDGYGANININAQVPYSKSTSAQKLRIKSSSGTITINYSLEGLVIFRLKGAEIKVSDGDHDARTDNPHSVTKAQVGLTNVDDKSEATIITDVKADGDIADAISKKHDAVTQGDGITVTGQQVSNSDRGSTAVGTHEASYDHTKLHDQNADTKLDEGGNNEVTASEIVKNIYNTVVLAFRVAVHGALTIFNMVDGIIDEYEDESGIDTGNSVNQVYDSTGDYYHPSKVHDTELALQYKLNDNAENTTVADSSDNNVNGTLQGGDNTSVKSVAGKINRAFNLNGTDDYINTNQTFQSVWQGSFSISVWVNLNDGQTAAAQTIFGIRAVTGIEDGLYGDIINGTIRFYYKSNNKAATRATTQVVLPNGVTGFHHLVFIGDSTVNGANGLKIYLDGELLVLASGGDTTDVVFADFATTTKFFVGAVSDEDRADFFLAGKIDDFRIYTKVLDNDEIASLYNSGNGTEGYINEVVQNMTLLSDVFTAETQPEKARMVLFEEDVDAITVNTDLIAQVTRDGTHWANVSLSDEGDYETGKRVLVGVADLSGQDAGTDMQYKLTSANNKDLKIHCGSLLWD